MDYIIKYLDGRPGDFAISLTLARNIVADRFRQKMRAKRRWTPETEVKSWEVCPTARSGDGRCVAIITAGKYDSNRRSPAPPGTPSYVWTAKDGLVEISLDFIP